ncbi:unnamed protein product [Closterium sp. Naga37s-1]|nr:unnamed protein product [Closterium sp. Naga37s-1]
MLDHRAAYFVRVQTSNRVLDAVKTKTLLVRRLPPLHKLHLHQQATDDIRSQLCRDPLQHNLHRLRMKRTQLDVGRVFRELPTQLQLLAFERVVFNLPLPDGKHVIHRRKDNLQPAETCLRQVPRAAHSPEAATAEAGSETPEPDHFLKPSLQTHPSIH